MAAVRLKYTGDVSPVDLSTVPGVDPTMRSVATGDVIEVPEEVAGQPPFWRALADDEPEYPWREHRKNDDVTEVRDLGSGLLAQVGNWQKAGGHPAKKTAPDKNTQEA